MSKSLALVVFLLSTVISGMSDTLFSKKFGGSTVFRADKGHGLKDCQDCNNKKEHGISAKSLVEDTQYVHSDEGIDITVAYTDVSGDVRTHTISSRDLSFSWVWENPGDGKHSIEKTKVRDWPSQQIMSKSENDIRPFVDQSRQTNSITPLKLKRQQLRQRRREKRTAELINMSEETELEIQATAIKRSKEFNSTTRGRYSTWRIEYQNPKSDTTLKLMKDQIIMAKVYASIAHSVENIDLHDSLFKYIRKNQRAIEDASTDADLQQDALECAKSMGHALSIAKDVLYDCDMVDRKLRAMIQSTERTINAVKKQSTFLIQHAAKTVPRPLHCLPLHLTTDYYLHTYDNKELSDNNSKLSNSFLYHYAIFSDNVLATSVVVNSTAVHAKEPEKHVFHIVTDRLNFAAMRMWFIRHPPLPATVEVQNIDEFKWLNSSYCAVLRQLESARIKEYYFKANHPSSLSTENENLKYRNPKYLSMLNHLRFYMPEVYPNLNKILFLDDDIVVQKDLTPLWSIDMKGMVNGAVETCKESFHRFETYLNFSNPKISSNFNPQACGWAFGMNIFDLKEWKRRNITGIYHYWQELNEDRKLWKLGSLPPGLITFYNLTYPLDRRWHVLGLGYDPAINPLEIENAAVIHYNGNYKPWLDLAIIKYKTYWSKYVNYEDAYIKSCSMVH